MAQGSFGVGPGVVQLVTGRRWVWVPEGQEPPALDLPWRFQVLPRRWVVERTLAWLVRNRRLSKD